MTNATLQSCRQRAASGDAHVRGVQPFDAMRAGAGGILEGLPETRQGATAIPVTHNMTQATQYNVHCGPRGGGCAGSSSTVGSAQQNSHGCGSWIAGNHSVVCVVLPRMLVGNGHESSVRLVERGAPTGRRIGDSRWIAAAGSDS